MMPLVKICGIRDVEHALAASLAGADLLGFVFVPVRRAIAPENARRIIEVIRSDGSRSPAAVGLFVNEPAEKINVIAAEVDLDLVQLSGNEPPELASEIDCPVIKAIRIEAGETIADVSRRIERHLEFSAGVLIDSHVKGQWGGTGVVGDWSMAARLAVQYPVVLAGGLTPSNVANAIRSVQPAVVDVSSGVETDGEKDAGKIREFIAAAQRAQSAVDAISPASVFIDLIREIQQERTASGIEA